MREAWLCAWSSAGQTWCSDDEHHLSTVDVDQSLQLSAPEQSLCGSREVAQFNRSRNAPHSCDVYGRPCLESWTPSSVTDNISTTVRLAHAGTHTLLRAS